MSTISDRDGSLTDADKTKVDAARAAARARFARFASSDEVKALAIVDPATVDPDNAPMTDAQLTRLRPAAEVVPGLVAASLRRDGGQPRATHSAAMDSVRLDSDVVEALRSSGEGWQDRVNDLLRCALAIGPGTVLRSEADDAAWLENMSDIVRRASAGEPVAPDEVKRMAEAVDRQMEPARSREARA